MQLLLPNLLRRARPHPFENRFRRMQAEALRRQRSESKRRISELQNHPASSILTQDLYRDKRHLSSIARTHHGDPHQHHIYTLIRTRGTRRLHRKWVMIPHRRPQRHLHIDSKIQIIEPSPQLRQSSRYKAMYLEMPLLLQTLRG